MTALIAPDGEIIGIDQHGRAVVWEHKETDEGDCYYCGHVVYAQWKRGRTKGKQKAAWVADDVLLFVFRDVAIPLAERTASCHRWQTVIRLVAAHTDCMERYSIDWAIAPGRMIHRSTCVHARADAVRFHGRRREAEWEQERLWESDPRYRYRGFCDLCAPIEFWCEPYVGGQVHDA